MTDGHIIVTINGKDVGLRFTMWAIEKMGEIRAQKPNSLIWDTVSMIAAGYFNNCRIEKAAPELTTDDFENYADELYSTEGGAAILESIRTVLTSTYVYKQLEGKAEEAKKKI